ncbi:MAG: PhzF family phenazine biosynthesis protein [Anaerolineaceae bacterium]|jgi:PhzF family phenazine biosynthesis protein
MKYPIYQVDAFAVKPFKGNPAAVVMLEESHPGSWMQSVAQEVNLSETAFLRPKGHDYELRWFTPTTEVDLCGHATLASAHILYEFGFYDPDETISFHTRSGVISSTFSRGTIELNMPRFGFKPAKTPAGLVEILGVEPVAVSLSENDTLIAEMPNAALIRDFKPVCDEINNLAHEGLAITALSDDPKYDFISRYFSPQTGVPEDPVTGMAHCLLGPYWQDKTGKRSFHAYQASARGGEVWIRLTDTRAFIGGKAVTVFKGEMLKQSMVE